MTEIDPSAEIRISHDAGEVTVMLPLDGPVTQEWQQRYDALAKAQGVRARIVAREKAWIIFGLSVPAERADIEAPEARGAAPDRGSSYADSMASARV